MGKLQYEDATVEDQRSIDELTLTADWTTKIYGDALTLGNTAFTTLDKDGDSVLPNGELVDTGHW